MCRLPRSKVAFVASLAEGVVPLPSRCRLALVAKEPGSPRRQGQERTSFFFARDQTECPSCLSMERIHSCFLEASKFPRSIAIWYCRFHSDHCVLGRTVQAFGRVP